MAKGNPNPKTEHLKATQFKKGVKHDSKMLSDKLRKYWKQRKDILFYVNEFEGKTIEEIEELVNEIKAGKKQGISAGCYVALKLWGNLIKGDLNAYREYMDRKYGRAKQDITQVTTVNGGLPLGINFITTTPKKDE